MKYIIILLVLIASSFEDKDSLAFNLYNILSQNQTSNQIFSPYSLKIVLAMLSEGCKGTSASQIWNACGLSTNTKQRLSEIQKEMNLMNNQSDVELTISNAIWPQSSNQFHLQQDYKNTIIKVYRAQVQELDFINSSEESRKRINEVVSNETNNKIQNLLAKGMITSDTRLVLTNCIYFKGNWKTQFPVENTYISSFKLANSSIIKVNMMHMMKIKLMYYEDPTFQLIDLPYQGDKISMFVLVPRENFDEKEMSSQMFCQYKNLMRSTEAKVYLPKFKFEWELEMNEILEEIGIKEIFYPSADLSGIDGNKDLYVTKVVQKTFIEVNERGTEAAAATAAVIARNSASPTQTKTIIADHPFIIFIVNHDTEEILFMGKVNDPGQVKNDFEIHLTHQQLPVRKELFGSLLGCFMFLMIGYLLVLFG